MAHRCSCVGPSPPLITGVSPSPSTSPSPPRSAMGTHLSGHLNPRQGDQSNRLASLKLLPNLWTTAGETPHRKLSSIAAASGHRRSPPPIDPDHHITPSEDRPNPLTLPGRFSLAAGDHRRQNLTGESQLSS
jgi:hypothetical protein